MYCGAGAAVRTLCLALLLTPSARGTVLHILDEHQPSMPHFRGVISRAQAQAIIDELRKERDR